MYTQQRERQLLDSIRSNATKLGQRGVAIEKFDFDMDGEHIDLIFTVAHGGYDVICDEVNHDVCVLDHETNNTYGFSDVSKAIDFIQRR